MVSDVVTGAKCRVEKKFSFLRTNLCDFFYFYHTTTFDAETNKHMRLKKKFLTEFIKIQQFQAKGNNKQKIGFNIKWPFLLTRLHSSRMRTARALTVSPSMLCGGGGGSGGRVFAPVGLWYPSMH